MAANVAISYKTILKQGNLGVPLFLLVIMAMMTLPMPPFMLDMFFTFNIALSLVVLLVVAGARAECVPAPQSNSSHLEEVAEV